MKNSTKNILIGFIVMFGLVYLFSLLLPKNPAPVIDHNLGIKLFNESGEEIFSGNIFAIEDPNFFKGIHSARIQDTNRHEVI